MKKILLLCLFLPMMAWSQLTIKINYAAHLTPLADDLFLTGTFNTWVENSPAYKFTRTGFNIFEITINPAPGLLEYKVTRGTWATVEATANGTNISNRTFNYTGTATTINIQINGWMDIGGDAQTTSTSNVHLLNTHFAIPQLNRTRKVWIYLPPDYHTSQKNYPVLYMHDGQNLFDQNTSSVGEWAVDESLNTLFSQGDYGVIVVGVDNGGSDRLNEYSPWVNPSYGGGQGDEFMLWMVNNLKPTIDSAFRTNPQPQFTGIMGSSMGGVISQYAAIQYPQTFKKIGLLSPAFWFTDSLFIQEHVLGVQADMKFYFVSGTTEATTMVPLMVNMRDSLIHDGLDSARTKLLTWADGQHSEWFWKREFPAAYQWLFSDLYINTSSKDMYSNSLNDFQLFPNPASDHISIHSKNNETCWNVQLLNANGELLLEQKIKNDEILNTSNLANGLYLLKGLDSKGYSVTKKIIIQH
jgi:predicted alpha/beta superfamily hydrolase